MKRVFGIGDTHFGHGNILKYEPAYRPFSSIEEHDETLVKNWNSAVNPTDTVWHFGDVVFGRGSLKILERLNGHKRLILGNHDTASFAELEKYFSTIVPYAKYKGVLLSHIPVHPCQIGRYRGNIHGHMHGKDVGDPRYFNISAEKINLTPILLDKVISTFAAEPEIKSDRE